MEYNYTREFKQPNKVYSFPNGTPIPLAPNGIRLEHLAVGGLFILIFLIIFVISLVTDIGFIQSMFKNGWMIILAAVFVIVWTLFSLKWDNKNFVNYILDRSTYYKNKNKRYEHTMLVPFFHESVTYQVKKKKH